MRVHDILSASSFNSIIKSYVKYSGMILICYKYNIAYELTVMAETVM